MSETSGDRHPPCAGDPARPDASPGSADDAGQAPGPCWSSLPEPVRSRLAEAASLAVGALPVDDVPIPLRRLARFTPAKRSRLGRSALLTELESSAAFRAAVVAWWDEHRPGELMPSADDPLAAAAASLLVADPGAAEAVAPSARRGQAREPRAVRDEELREKAAADLVALAAEGDRERKRAEAERRRAADAVAEVAAARQAAREARQADEVRLGLLLDTVGGALSGLRRELALGGGGPRPGDLVVGARSVRGGGPVDSVPALDALLSVTSVHLVVDGYNVTKTGYPELPLADQRTRLAGQLAALAARTGVEITVVFDGAGVVAAPTRGSRGVRVLFSDPGVLADDVIRALVAAEPQGRPVVVATSDKAVVTSVCAHGAHSVPSRLLLHRLTRS